MNNLQKVEGSETIKNVDVMYNCYLEVEEFMGKNFIIVLGYRESDYKREFELPFNKFISDFETLEVKMYAMAAVEDLFLLNEVKKLELALKKYPSIKFRYEPANLPIKGDLFPFDWKYTRSELNLFDYLKFDDSCKLDFEVCCYYDINNV